MLTFIAFCPSGPSPGCLAYERQELTNHDFAYSFFSVGAVFNESEVSIKMQLLILNKLKSQICEARN